MNEGDEKSKLSQRSNDSDSGSRFRVRVSVWYMILYCLLKRAEQQVEEDLPSRKKREDSFIISIATDTRFFWPPEMPAGRISRKVLWNQD